MGYLKEVYLKVHGEQAVKLEKGTIELKYYFKQIPVSFKIYADFECILKNVKSNEGSCTKNIKITFFPVFVRSLFVLMINLVNQLFFVELKMLLINLLKQFCKSLIIAKSSKKHFNKIIIMTEEEENFESRDTCWTCERLIENEKVRDYCHITIEKRIDMLLIRAVM